MLLVAVVATFYLKGQSTFIATDRTTLCPSSQPPSEVVVILLDISDQFSEPQRLQVQNHLTRVRDGIRRFGLVEVYAVDRLGRRVTQPVVHLCNPGTGADLNRIYQSPELARRAWAKFAAKLTAEIDRQLSAADATMSPIFEAVQATALRTFGRPEYDELPKRLVIVSDMLQHVPGRLSMYAAVPPFESFEATPYFSRVRAELQDVSVSIYYLSRARVATQGRAHVAFWDAYFRSQGAAIESVQRINGDE